MPASWDRQSQGYGLSQEEKKVYGVSLTGPEEGGRAPRISAHYYAPDNLLDKTAEKYIRVHSSRQPAGTAAFPGLPKVKDGKVGGMATVIFAKVTLARGQEDGSQDQPEVVWESFAVIRLEKGYYALRYSAPAERYAQTLPVFEAFLASFKPLLK